MRIVLLFPVIAVALYGGACFSQVIDPDQNPDDAPYTALDQFISNTKNSNALMDTYAGISASNNKLLRDGKEAFYCIPAGLYLTKEQIYDIVYRYLTKNKDKYDTSDDAFALAIFDAVSGIFPCKKN